MSPRGARRTVAGLNLWRRQGCFGLRTRFASLLHRFADPSLEAAYSLQRCWGGCA